MAQQAGWRNKLRQKLPDWLADLLGNTLGAVIAGLILFAVGISVVVVVVNKVEDNGGDAPTTTTTTTTSTTTTTTSTTTTTLPPSVVVISANNPDGADFVAPANGTYRFTMRSGTRYCTAPNLCRSVIRGFDNQPVTFGGSPIPEPTGYRWTGGVPCAV